ncbi:ABC transporter permease [Bacteroides fluxus]|uniref:ABC transporter permease n=1 Tax=Bacteroides fluxus TaxID=626930 RepID=UPI0023A87537|nr:ABC transporter permease subunit [Bacteroides fluxus]
MKWKLLFPDVERMWQVFSEQIPFFMNNWLETFIVSFCGSLCALFFALLLSVIAFRFRLFDVIMMPIVAVSQSFPLQAIAPLIIIVMGVGFRTKILIAFLIAFFPIYGACITAIKTTPKNLICFSKIYRTSFLKEIYYIRFPYAFPAVISAVKVGFTLAVLGAVVAEFIQPDAGLGRLILIAQSKYDIEIIYICIMMLVVQGLFVYISLSKVENMLINRGGYKNE